MKKQIFYVLMLLCAIIMGSCSSKDSMDSETHKMLEETYGKRVVVEVNKAGTLSDELKDWNKGAIAYMKIVGPIDGNDIYYLDTVNYNLQTMALDLLDAHIAACEGEHATKENTITRNLFGGMSAHLYQLFLPLDLTTIEDEAFISQWNMQYVRIPSTVTTIGASAFSGNSNLQSIELPEGLTSLGESAFHGCEQLKSIRLPRSITSLGGHLGDFEDIYMSWTPEEFAQFGEQDFSYVEFSDSERGRFTFTFKKPTLHVPAEMVDGYKEIMKGYKVVSDSEEENETETEAATLNNELLGKWCNNNDPVINMVVSDKNGDYDGNKGYGYIEASNEYFEMDYKLVFTSLTPDGDNIKVHYNKMEMQFTGDPDDYDSEGTYEEVKAGEGDLTLSPAGSNKLKISSKEKRINNATLYK